MRLKAKQIIAVIALIAFVFFTVFSTVGLVISASHTCAGIHCRSCERIATIQNVVSAIKAALVVIAALLFVSEIIKLLVAKAPPAFHVITAVTLKTKLSN